MRAQWAARHACLPAPARWCSKAGDGPSSLFPAFLSLLPPLLQVTSGSFSPTKYTQIRQQAAEARQERLTKAANAPPPYALSSSSDDGPGSNTNRAPSKHLRSAAAPAEVLYDAATWQARHQEAREGAAASRRRNQSGISGF